MTDKNIDRAMGAVIGALIGDSLGVGPHWYYDPDKMKRDYGSGLMYIKKSKPDRFHSGIKPG